MIKNVFLLKTANVKNKQIAENTWTESDVTENE